MNDVLYVVVGACLIALLCFVVYKIPRGDCAVCGGVGFLMIDPLLLCPHCCGSGRNLP